MIVSWNQEEKEKERRRKEAEEAEERRLRQRRINPLRSSARRNDNAAPESRDVERSHFDDGKSGHLSCFGVLFFLAFPFFIPRSV